MTRLFTALLALLLLSPTFAQRCLPELQAGLTQTELTEPATGRDAAVYLQRAVDLLEPVLPPLVAPGELPVSADDESYDAVRFLAERDLLPTAWEPNALTSETWTAMAAGVGAWYGLSAADAVAPPTKGQLVDDLAALIDQAAPQLDPVALLAFDPQAGSVSFWAVIRNGGVYPRMIVRRPPEEALDARRDPAEALARLGSCAYTLSNYVSAPADTAQRLFLANSDAQMVVAEAAPIFDGLIYVPEGEESDYLRFSSSATSDYERYAALFVGPSIGVPALLRIIPQLRTNMNPGEIIAFVRGS